MSVPFFLTKPIGTKMRLKIVEAGWENFTGNFGGAEFVDSVSVDEVSTFAAQHLAAVIQVENVETGKSPSVAQMLVDARNQAMDANLELENTTGITSVTVIHNTDGTPWTKEQLEAIADEKGILGLREIADFHPNVKANSINKLIENILKAGIVDVDSVDAIGGDDSKFPKDNTTASFAASSVDFVAPGEVLPVATAVVVAEQAAMFVSPEAQAKAAAVKLNASEAESVVVTESEK